MAVQYRYERFHQALDGTITVEALTWNSDFPSEQAAIVVEFPDGTTVQDIETKIQNYTNIVGTLARS